MFHEGVTCSDCHEPHSLKLRFEKNGVCLQCHSAERFETPDHHHHAMNTPGAECASCHMPERTYMVVDRRRDHSFRIPRPDLSAALDTPNTCNACHSQETPAWAAAQIAAWHPEPHRGFQQFANALHDGDLGAPGARQRLLELAATPDQPGIARASALDRLDRITDQAAFATLQTLLADPDPLVRRSAVGVFASVPAQYRQPLMAIAEDPVLDVRLEAARLIAEIPDAALDPEAVVPRERLLAEYRAAQASNPDWPQSHHSLGIFEMALGRYDDAERAFREALKVDPMFVPAAVNLADLLQALGRDAEGEPILRDLISRVPNDPGAHLALGLWLVRNGRGDEALDELRIAAERGEESPRFAYVYAVALADRGERRGDDPHPRREPHPAPLRPRHADRRWRSTSARPGTSKRRSAMPNCSPASSPTTPRSAISWRNFGSDEQGRRGRRTAAGIGVAARTLPPRSTSGSYQLTKALTRVPGVRETWRASYLR